MINLSIDQSIVQQIQQINILFTIIYSITTHITNCKIYFLTASSSQVHKLLQFYSRHSSQYTLFHHLQDLTISTNSTNSTTFPQQTSTSILRIPSS